MKTDDSVYLGTKVTDDKVKLRYFKTTNEDVKMIGCMWSVENNVQSMPKVLYINRCMFLHTLLMEVRIWRKNKN